MLKKLREGKEIETDKVCSRGAGWQWYLESRAQDKGSSYRGSLGGLVQICVWWSYEKIKKVVSTGLSFSPQVGTRSSANIYASRAESFRDMERFCKCHQWSMGKGGCQWERGICLVGEGESSSNCKITLQLAIDLLFPGVLKSHILLCAHCHSSEEAAFPDTANAAVGMKPWKETVWNGREEDFFTLPLISVLCVI